MEWEVYRNGFELPVATQTNARFVWMQICTEILRMVCKEQGAHNLADSKIRQNKQIHLIQC